MKNIIRKIYYAILYILPARIAINIENIRTYRRLLNEKKPEYFGEKIQWLKLYGNLEQYSYVVDKYEVRHYVSDRIGEDYLIPLIGVFNNVEDINYNQLPNNFVLKSNNGSSMNIIVKNKEKLNIKKTNRVLNKWLKSKYYKIKKEYQYRNVENKILIEKYISDKNDELLDYKFFCFNGNPEFLKVDYNRYTDHKVNFYDMEWKRIDLKEQGYDNYNKDIESPKNFKKMVQIVKELSREFQFVRVDLYNVDGKIYFGELTFTPASGMHAFYPLKKDKEIGEKIKLRIQ